MQEPGETAESGTTRSDYEQTTSDGSYDSYDDSTTSSVSSSSSAGTSTSTSVNATSNNLSARQLRHKLRHLAARDDEDGESWRVYTAASFIY